MDLEKYYLKQEDTAVLVVDMQEKLHVAMSNQERLLRRMKLVLKVAETYALPVLVTEQYPKGLGKTIAELGLAEIPHQVFEKITYSGVTPEFAQALAQTGRKQILVIGIEAHVCVLQTVRDLQKMDYQCYLVVDAVDTRFPENYANALELMRDMGVIMLTAEGVAFDLMQRAGTPEFKQIHPVLK